MFRLNSIFEWVFDHSYAYWGIPILASVVWVISLGLYSNLHHDEFSRVAGVLFLCASPVSVCLLVMLGSKLVSECVSEKVDKYVEANPPQETCERLTWVTSEIEKLVNQR